MPFFFLAPWEGRKGKRREGCGQVVEARPILPPALTDPTNDRAPRGSWKVKPPEARRKKSLTQSASPSPVLPPTATNYTLATYSCCPFWLGLISSRSPVSLNELHSFLLSRATKSWIYFHSRISRLQSSSHSISCLCSPRHQNETCLIVY